MVLENMGETIEDAGLRFEVVEVWYPMPGYKAVSVKTTDEDGNQVGYHTKMNGPDGEWFPVS